MVQPRPTDGRGILVYSPNSPKPQPTPYRTNSYIDFAALSHQRALKYICTYSRTSRFAELVWLENPKPE
jgi:hypothetical protein